MREYSNLLTRRQRLVCDVSISLLVTAAVGCAIWACTFGYDPSRWWWFIPGFILSCIASRIDYWKKYHRAPPDEKEAYKAAVNRAYVKIFLYTLFLPLTLCILFFAIFCRNSTK